MADEAIKAVEKAERRDAKKRFEIEKFASAKTIEMIKFSAWRAAEGLTLLENPKDFWKRFEENLREAEKRLKEYILSVPF